MASNTAIITVNGPFQILSGGNVALIVAEGSDVVAVNELRTNFGFQMSDGIYASGIQVVSFQQAAIPDATGAGDVVARLNDLLAAIRAHGLVAT